MGILLALVFSASFLAAGSALIYGTQNRWPMLTDPPEDMWICYTHSFLKKVFGKQFLIYYNYAFGVIFFLAGMMCLIGLFVS